MTYRQNVEASHRRTYADNVQMVAQERMSKIRSAVTIVSGLSGDAHNVRDLLEEAEYREDEDYSGQNPEIHSKLDPVWLLRPKVIEWGRTIFKEDQFDLAMDPTSQFVSNGVRACEKGVFDRFVGIKPKAGGGFEIAGNGLLGNRVSGKDHATKAALPGDRYLLHGGEGMTLAKLIAAREMLELDDFGLDEDLSSELFCLLTPKQKTDLLNIAAATGTALNQFELQQIKEGRPTTLMGATWMFTNRLPVNAAGHRLCPMWTKSNVLGAFWQDIQGDMWNRSESKNRPYVYNDCFPTGTRIEDKGVVVIPCVET